MTLKVHESSRVTVDLTRVPYFAAQSAPLVLQEASGLERVRGTVEAIPTQPTYAMDRTPGPVDSSQFFGGLGLASVMDVGAHPLRARARRINVLMIFAVAALVTVALVMAEVVVTFKH
ncbi:MAG TPA: hypothetical protein VHD81_04880 [Mycobacteriales bacterium]|nr:hypothetical protein [Mycobacteriales bacterium]